MAFWASNNTEELNRWIDGLIVGNSAENARTCAFQTVVKINDLNSNFTAFVTFMAKLF